ncbi:unnamed protein product, partial [Amoebophrya sp. A25]
TQTTADVDVWSVRGKFFTGQKVRFDAYAAKDRDRIEISATHMVCSFGKKVSPDVAQQQRLICMYTDIAWPPEDSGKTEYVKRTLVVTYDR